MSCFVDFPANLSIERFLKQLQSNKKYNYNIRKNAYLLKMLFIKKG